MKRVNLASKKISFNTKNDLIVHRDRENTSIRIKVRKTKDSKIYSYDTIERITKNGRNVFYKTNNLSNSSVIKRALIVCEKDDKVDNLKTFLMSSEYFDDVVVLNCFDKHEVMDKLEDIAKICRICPDKKIHIMLAFCKVNCVTDDELKSWLCNLPKHARLFLLFSYTSLNLKHKYKCDNLDTVSIIGREPLYAQDVLLICSRSWTSIFDLFVLNYQDDISMFDLVSNMKKHGKIHLYSSKPIDVRTLFNYLRKG